MKLLHFQGTEGTCINLSYRTIVNIHCVISQTRIPGEDVTLFFFFCAPAVRLRSKSLVFYYLLHLDASFLWDYTRSYEHCRSPIWIVRLLQSLFIRLSTRGSALFVQWLRCQGCRDAKMPAAGRECRQLSGLWCFWQRCWFSTAVSPRARFWPHASALAEWRQTLVRSGWPRPAGTFWQPNDATGIGSCS